MLLSVAGTVALAAGMTSSAQAARGKHGHAAHATHGHAAHATHGHAAAAHSTKPRAHAAGHKIA
jgi:hypothetical protein